MTEPLSALDRHRIDPDGVAVFLDFDGTLVEIAEHPDQVALYPETRRALERLSAALGGALAVITGRNIADVDRLLAPLHLPAAGVHGLERRGRDGQLHAAGVDGQEVSRLVERLQAFVETAPGLFLERKSASAALHYRARPELEDRCIEAMDAAVEGIKGIHIIRGKKVIEAKADARNKGGAVREFLFEPPFHGRMPLFAGDDVTDEDAFAAIAESGGISIKVGPGETAAAYRADDIDQFLAWLVALAEDLERMKSLERS